MPNKLVKYNNTDFEGLKQNLLNFVKQYYPESFSSISDYSIEMLLLELNSYVGDVLGFYLDDRNKERYVQFATEKESLFRLAKTLGYKTKTVSVALGEVTIFQSVPNTINENGQNIPDASFAATISSGMICSNGTSSSVVTTIEICNMKQYDDSSVESEDEFGNPTTWLLSKKVKVRTGKKQFKSITINDPIPYLNLFVDENVAYIESVIDSEGNRWFEVDYLSRDVVFDSVNNDFFIVNSNDSEKILKIRRVPRRFEVEHNSLGECFLKFGSGIDTIDDSLRQVTYEDLISNNNEVVQPTFNSTFLVEQFINNDSFGLTPFNTTMNITYITSRGDIDNIKANNISTINRIEPSFSLEVVPDEVRNSFRVTNEEEIVGSQLLNDFEKVKSELPKAFSSQNRCITSRDYMLRTLMMPKQFGNITKVFVQAEKINDVNILGIYIVTTGEDGTFKPASKQIKENLVKYLSAFKSENDTIVVKNAYIVNIGLNIELTIKEGFNEQTTIFDAVRKAEEFFANTNMEINKAIIIKELENKIYEVEGVRYINKISFENKFDTNEGYSGVQFTTNIERGIVYTPTNPAIFEVKYSQEDITISYV
jgi:hypothetical protein